MRKRKMALVLAALLAVSGTGEAVMVSAADFSQAEEVLSEEDFSGADVISSEELEEPGTFEAEQPEEIDDEIFGEADLFTQGEENAQGEAYYCGGYVTQEEFQAWVENDDNIPDSREVVEADSWSGFLEEAGKQESTGYVLLEVRDTASVYQDLVIPEGMTVGFLGFAESHDCTDMNIQSLTANGNVVLAGMIHTPGNLEMKNGSGSVTIRNAEIEGNIQGNGVDTTVTFLEWASIGGIHGVKNMIFGDNMHSIRITSGYADFYHMEHNGPFYVETIGYSENRLPVFHEPFDFGTVQSEDGSEEWQALIDVGFHTDGTEHGTQIFPGEGKPVVKFVMPDEEILEIYNRIGFGIEYVAEYLSVDIDGTLFKNDPSVVGQEPYYITQVLDTKQLSAEDVFFGEGSEDEANFSENYFSGTMENVLRIMRALNNRSESKGYFFVDVKSGLNYQKTIVIPEQVAGVRFFAHYDNEQEIHLPFSFSDIRTSGSAVTLENMYSSGGTLTISGGGIVNFRDCRVNQKVTVDAGVEMLRSTINSLTCKELALHEDWSLVGEALNCGTVYLGDSILVTAPTAVLNIEIIDLRKPGETVGNFGEIWCLNSNGQRASIHLSDTLVLGEPSEDNFRMWILAMVDYEKAKAAGAAGTGDIYDREYGIWTDNEDLNLGNENFLMDNDGTQGLCLLTVSEKAGESIDWGHVAVTYVGKSAQITKGFLQYEDLMEELGDYPATEVVNGQVRYTTWLGGRDGISKSTDYVLVSDAPVVAPISIAKASVTGLNNAYYTGKAITRNFAVNLDGKALVEGTDYQVTYTNNVKIGTATITIQGMGSYTGTLTKTFKIYPKKGAIYTVGALKYKIMGTAAVQVTGPKVKTYTGITIPSTVTIQGYTYKVTSVGVNAFKGCTNLKKVVVGHQVTHIYANAFYGCSKLSAVTLGRSVTHIYGNVFYGCKVLKTIAINSSQLTAINKLAFRGMYAKAVIKVPAAKLTAYQKLLKGRGQASTVKITK